MTNHTTQRFVITGIRYQMPGDSKEEQTENARRLVESMPLPAQVYLKREPDNAWSRNAIAVYWKFSKLGYVSENYTADVQRAFGGASSSADRLLSATVTGWNSTLMLDAEVEVPEDPSAPCTERARAIKPSPFAIPMPFIEEENRLDFLAQLMFHEDLTREDTDRLIKMATQYLAIAPSLCDSDCRNASRLHRGLRRHREAFPTLPDGKLQELKQLEERARTVVVSIQKEDGMPVIFESHLRKMGEEFSKPGSGFFARYDATCFHLPLTEAGEGEIKAEMQRLVAWLDEVPMGIFSPHSWQPEAIARRLRYLHLSRREFYDVAGAALVVRRLGQELARRKQQAEAQMQAQAQPLGAHHPVPEDCREAADRVFVPTFTLPDKTVLNSRQQVARAAREIDLSKGVQVAMLMKVGMEWKAVRPGASCPDFVRALTGIGVMECAGARAVARMADVMAKRLNGYTSRGKRHPPLPDSHLLWSGRDKAVGRRIYDAMAGCG